MSKKQRSLFVQSMTAIEGCFSYRYDKHSAKHQNGQAEQGWRVCSFSAKSNLLDTAHNLCEYIKEHYPDIDKVRQIRPSHCQEWLDSKAKDGCSYSTIETYKSNLMKLSRVINHHFGVHTNFETKVNAELIPDRTSPREFALTPDEVQRVKDSIGKPCHSSNFFIFSSYTCCRVNQVSVLQKKHITFGDDRKTVSVLLEKDKGGRQNLIEVTDKEFYSFCRLLTSDKGDNDSLFGNIKPNSANRWLNRKLAALSITTPQAKTIGTKTVLKSGNHSIRKAAIQTYYNKQYKHYIDLGYSPEKADKTAKSDCCVRLSHGSENRSDIIQIYLGAKS